MAYHLHKRRKAPRAPLNRPVQLQAGKHKLVCRGIEVGSGGMSLWSEKAFQPDTMVTVSFSLPASATTITAMARVAWCRQPASARSLARLGMQFVALSREERENIRSFVNRLAKNYRDLHILLAMNQWKMDQLQQLARRANLDSYRDVQDLKKKVAKAMDGFRA